MEMIVDAALYCGGMQADLCLPSPPAVADQAHKADAQEREGGGFWHSNMERNKVVLLEGRSPPAIKDL